METQPTKTETLLGGAECLLIFADGHEELVKIKQLPIKDFPKLLKAQDDEGEMIELFTGRALDLTPESHELVVTEGERLNRDFFTRWVQRRLDRQERLFPGITQKALASRLPTGPAKSPSNAA